MVGKIKKKQSSPLVYRTQFSKLPYKEAVPFGYSIEPTYLIGNKGIINESL
jgi:hypothetical protein